MAEAIAFSFDTRGNFDTHVSLNAAVTPTKRGRQQIEDDQFDASACSEFPLLTAGSWDPKESIERMKRQLEERPYNPKRTVTADQLREKLKRLQKGS